MIPSITRNYGLRFMYRSAFFFLFVLSATVVFAQKKQKAVLHFGTAEYQLTLRQEKYLDSFAATLANTPGAYRFIIAGHTDSIGSAAYNKSLSFKRAGAVASYLEKKGFRQSRMKLEGNSYAIPIANNSTEENKEKNRRVEIEFRLTLPTIKTIGGISLPKEHFTIDENGGTVVSTSGTRITIPPDAFADNKGQPVKGRIDIQYYDYRDPVDFLLSDIPMHYNSGDDNIPFNSAGMFTINASQGNTPVSLREGKRIGVNFNYDGTVNDPGFFKWDEVQRKWTALQQLRGSLLDPFKEYMMFLNTDCMLPVCSEHEDLKRVFFVQKGLQYTEATDSSIYRMYEAAKLYDLKREAMQQQKIFERKAKQMLRKYQVEIDEVFMGKEILRIVQFRGKRDVASRMLDNVEFKKRLDTRMKDSINRLIFDDISIQATDSGYDIVLYKGLARFEIKNVTIQQNKTIKNMGTERWIADLNASLENYKRTARAYRDTTEMFARQMEFFDHHLGLIPGIRWNSLDSIQCFRNLHDGWVTNNQPGLSLADWLYQYQQNKPDFNRIYTGIQQTPEYAMIEKKVVRFRNLLLLYRNPEARLNLTTADLQLTGNFSLTSLGTYNCDQLQRLQDTLTVYAQYRNSKGEEILPVVALLIDSRLNGMLRYDGSYGWSPYRIAFRPQSVNRMVLIDMNGEAYLVKPDAFKEVDLNYSQRRMHTFVADRIDKTKNKEALKEQLKL